MEVLPLLIIISLGVIAFAVWIFFRMSDSGQFDDTESPATRILMDDDRAPEEHAPPARKPD
jgi:cbb3-type cytochrome oxidase maturation protein